MKKNQLSYGIYLVVLVLLYSLLSGCQNTENHILDGDQQSSHLSSESNDRSDESVQDTRMEFHTESSQVVSENIQVEENAEEEERAQEKYEKMTEFVVEPGVTLTEILTNLVIAGWGENVESLLYQLDQADRSRYMYWSEIENAAERAFAAEGYIAPGRYEWKATATVEEVLDLLMASWDGILTNDILKQAEKQGYTMDEVLIMASIVEWESSFDPYNIVKPNVAAVVRNRIESETALQMDVTIFYLQESLEPYRDPQQYEFFYDTYIRSALPSGPIGSPSIESIQAVLKPADTKDLFFVYDDEGNYYFAEDYEQHLANCELAGIY